jgi:hypothetical protein
MSVVQPWSGHGRVTHIRNRLLHLKRVVSLLTPLKTFKLCLILWLRHYATNRKVAGSSPDEVDFF